MRVPRTARRSNQSILRESSPEYSLEGLMLKLQYFGHLTQRADSLKKTLMLVKIEGRRRRDEMVGWHHQLNGHKFEYILGVGDVEGGLACCSPWGCKESDMTKQLNNNNKLHRLISGKIISTTLGKGQRFFIELEL